MAGNAEAAYRMTGCPSFTAMDTFEVQRYAGRWYEVARDAYIIFELFSNCVNVDYTLLEDRSV